MHTQTRISPIVAVLAGLLLTAGWSKATTTVDVGDSTLIGTLDYSDTFTANGTNRPDGGYQVAGMYKVENHYSNPAESWVYPNNGPWSINTNSSVSGGYGYPGDSGSGSSTGLTQSGGSQGQAPVTWGLNYTDSNGNPLRSDFVVQSDFVYSSVNSYYLGIGSNASAGTLNAADGIAVDFGTSDVLSLYNVNVGTTALSFSNSINGTNPVWANFAVEFNLNTDVLSIYADESLLGTVDLTTFDSGAYAAVLDDESNTAIEVGGSGNRIWTDNFEVGSAPEPTTYALMLGGVALLVLVARFRKLA